MSQKDNALFPGDTAKLLEKGYQEMAQINLELAQMCFEADCETLVRYEEKLTECE